MHSKAPVDIIDNHVCFADHCTRLHDGCVSTLRGAVDRLMTPGYPVERLPEEVAHAMSLMLRTFEFVCSELEIEITEYGQQKAPELEAIC